jgi:hypothetical protein
MAHLELGEEDTRDDFENLDTTCTELVINRNGSSNRNYE